MLSSRPSHHASRSTLARSYEQEGVELDDDDRDKLQMLDSYMASVEDAGADAPAPEEEDPADLPMPTKIEDVDAFMARRRAQTLAVGRQRPRQQCPSRAPLRPHLHPHATLPAPDAPSHACGLRALCLFGTAEAAGCRRLRRGETARRGGPRVGCHGENLGWGGDRVVKRLA